ncbi:hypothetical protein OSH11_01495 [Kaistia dalseonensis]|uniref:Uncharacterized protein n=1 Tax=Kaistia dalseonensis TaxID=410840 RepID=A0ABU0H1L5_9HYPH|nr:hypothetical protein [Kaistia dalseonensis]MCX5493369.1 hypothetical protein [Kaistia dalseonensis]MDQ0435927.1 hypothetical protein [Kaistia dalseonensis]
MPRGTVMSNLGATRKRLAFLVDLAIATSGERIDMDAEVSIGADNCPECIQNL